MLIIMIFTPVIIIFFLRSREGGFIKTTYYVQIYFVPYANYDVHVKLYQQSKINRDAIGFIHPQQSALFFLARIVRLQPVHDGIKIMFCQNSLCWSKNSSFWTDYTIMMIQFLKMR